MAICNGLTDYPIGRFGKDFTDLSSLLETLNTLAVTKIYDRITSYPSQKCKDCNRWEFCGGGCLLTWMAYKPEDVIVGL
jgi:radical SAM protein with 4Fe4S-binding SPASM domain